MARPKKGRYAQKLELGLVPHRYDKHSRRFQEGVTGGPFAARPRTGILRKGRHRFVTPEGIAA